jgi:hypothetical protein
MDSQQNSTKHSGKLSNIYDLMALFKEFHNETLNLFSLNFGIITVLPKQKEATHIKQFRPICLLNVSFKIFSKAAVNRITAVTRI